MRLSAGDCGLACGIPLLRWASNFLPRQRRTENSASSAEDELETEKLGMSEYAQRFAAMAGTAVCALFPAKELPRLR
jgi:hypothetical protein